MASTPTQSGKSDFDMRQNVETWQAFNRLAKWIVILSVITLVLMGYFLTGK